MGVSGFFVGVGIGGVLLFGLLLIPRVRDWRDARRARALAQERAEYARNLVATGTPPAMANALARAPDMFAEARRAEALRRQYEQQQQQQTAATHGDEGGA